MKDTFEILHEAIKPVLNKHECDYCKKQFYVYEIVNINHKLICFKCYKSKKI